MMNIEDIKRRYPDIVLEELFVHFSRMPMSDHPELSECFREDCHKGIVGAGGRQPGVVPGTVILSQTDKY